MAGGELLHLELGLGSRYNVSFEGELEVYQDKKGQGKERPGPTEDLGA